MNDLIKGILGFICFAGFLGAFVGFVIGPFIKCFYPLLCNLEHALCFCK